MPPKREVEVFFGSFYNIEERKRKREREEKGVLRCSFN